MFDRVSGQLNPVGTGRPWIDPRTMATRDVVRIAARDGLSIPTLITHPRRTTAMPQGAKVPAPMVVLVHGGPNVRGTRWGWEPSAQFLASLGYLVVEPEFRGSLGYGFRHFKAGWRQWGQAMQDDVTDVTRWAVERGLADPDRVCIAGASYGGYAALMGMIREPKLYRCAINWVGVTDMELLYTVPWSDTSEAAMGYSMPLLIGDPRQDQAMMRQQRGLLEPGCAFPECAHRRRRQTLIAPSGKPALE